MSDLVRAIRAGFHGQTYREPGDTFPVPDGAKASWWRLADGSEDDVSEEMTPDAPSDGTDGKPKRGGRKAKTDDGTAPTSNDPGDLSGTAKPDWVQG